MARSVPREERNMSFRDKEKERYSDLKAKLFSRAAQADGSYRGIPRPFCLADGYSAENLYDMIRKDAIQYFQDRKITWHDGPSNRSLPSNHLCCSQSCCINFLYPMTTSKQLVSAIFRQIYPDLAEPLRVDRDQPLPNGMFPYMAFEWIGVDDYLGETRRKGRERTRGTNFTSADFAFRFRRKGGKIQIVLGEWKYTEDYRPWDKGIEVRKQNYFEAFHRSNGVFQHCNDDIYNALFFEPFYQLMRLQLLAQEMEVGREMDAEVVSVLHICPEANREFRERVTSPYLEQIFPNRGTLEIWKQLVPEDKFRSISVEDLLDTIVKRAGAYDREWADYLRTRYGWSRGN